MKKFRRIIYKVFSDSVMIALALLIIPAMIVHSFFQLSPLQALLVKAVDWFIWIAFSLEFILKFLVAEKKIKWVVANWFDSIVSAVVIVSPLLEHFSSIFVGVPALRLLRLTRLTRLARLLALIFKVKHMWKKIELKVYVTFFLVLGAGFIASFAASKFQHSAVDMAWLSLFVSTFGVFYAVLISFFVVHIWSKFNAIGTEMSREVNSLRNVFLLEKQLPKKVKGNKLVLYINLYIDELVRRLWQKNFAVNPVTLSLRSGHSDYGVNPIHEKFLDLLSYFNQASIENKNDLVILDNIFAELRISSVAQSNLINLATDKTPKILWVLLIVLSTVLIGSFIFLGFQNQLLATVLISLVSAVTGLVVALIVDIDTPFQAGFWNITPNLYLELKKFVNSK